MRKRSQNVNAINQVRPPFEPTRYVNCITLKNNDNFYADLLKRIRYYWKKCETGLKHKEGEA